MQSPELTEGHFILALLHLVAVITWQLKVHTSNLKNRMLDVLCFWLLIIICIGLEVAYTEISMSYVLFTYSIVASRKGNCEVHLIFMPTSSVALATNFCYYFYFFPFHCVEVYNVSGILCFSFARPCLCC